MRISCTVLGERGAEMRRATQLPERGRFALLDLIICRGSDKSYLARSNHILVDDREKNIREWEAAGGIGIHHTGNFKETMEKLQAAVKTLAPSVNPAPPKPKLD